jgi:hypothetical protein
MAIQCRGSPNGARATADGLTGFQALSLGSHHLSAASISSLLNLYLTASGREAREDSRGPGFKVERLANFRGPVANVTQFLPAEILL